MKTFLKFPENDLLYNIINHVIKQNLSKEDIKSMHDIITLVDIRRAAIIIEFKIILHHILPTIETRFYIANAEKITRSIQNCIEVY